ncbi:MULTISPECIES: M16 family metallopeptidase [Clostridium]|uniref:M16 family metallopeptidase n=1 Tax=Clostridium TaxID=1485 RepID=UPI000826A641|nr:MULTISPECIES: insulinase family protein [Clostridium]PJI07701.1 insulinase family protein [Clostridium sp. CT7]
MRLNNDLNYNKVDQLESGTLRNGIKYYIYNNDVKEKLVRVSLVVKVGSLMEKSSKNGIAHFVEHMCIYNSDFAFKNKSNKNNLMLGYTDFEETVYFLNCEVDAIEDVLNNFKNILNGRNIVRTSMNSIKEELKMEIINESKTSKIKLQQAILPELIRVEDIKDKLPLGNLECILNLSFEEVQRFHNNLYKPENSAVFIVGSIEKYKVKKLLEKIFLTIEGCDLNYLKPTVKHSISSKKVLLNIVDNINYDEMQLYYLKPNLNYKSMEDLKLKIINYFALILIEEYIEEALRNNKVDFSNLKFVSEMLLSELNFNILELKVKQGILEKAKHVLNIIRKLKLYGISEKQFTEYKENFLYELTEYYSNNKVASNKIITKECINNYLYNEPLISVKHEYDLCCSIIKKISFRDFNIIIEKTLKNENMLISLNCKEGLSKDKDELDRIFRLNC